MAINVSINFCILRDFPLIISAVHLLVKYGFAVGAFLVDCVRNQGIQILYNADDRLGTASAQNVNANRMRHGIFHKIYSTTLVPELV